MKTPITFVAITLLLVSVGCNGAKTESADHIVDHWKQAGLSSTTFSSTTTEKLATDCWAGSTSGIETTLCRYSEGAAAKNAEKSGLAVVGNVTGVSLANGNWLLVIADRNKSDPNGKVINKIANVFRKIELVAAKPSS